MKDLEEGKSQAVLPNIGRHAARCYAIVDAGTQQTQFNGLPGKPTRQIYFFWEITSLMTKYKADEPEQPFALAQKYSYTISGDKAKLPVILKSWGKMTTKPTKLPVALLKKYLGQLCMLDIEHNEGKNGKIYANIGNKGLDVKPFDVNTPKPKAVHSLLFFDLDNFSWDDFNKLPKFPNMADVIGKSQEWPGIIAKHPQSGGQVVSQPQEETISGEEPGF